MIDWKVHTYASLPSTQDYVKELVEEGLEEGIVVQALEQKKGHGRHGREWVSPIGNLYMSMILRPDCALDKAGQMSFVAAVALSSAIDELMVKTHKKTLKWPNDILIDGKKICGIIIEKEKEGYAMGIGVNILSAPEEAISLKEIAGDARVAIHPFRDSVLKHYALYHEKWINDGFLPIRERWLANAHGIGSRIKIRGKDSEKTAIFRDIDENGHLVIEEENGTVAKINAGEVFFE